MWERPDNRAWLFFAPVLPLAIAFAAFPSDHVVGRIVEPILYAWCVVLGLGLGILSIREGYSLLHPSVTATESPILYWVEVLAGCFLFAGIAAWQTTKVLSRAL